MQISSISTQDFLFERPKCVIKKLETQLFSPPAGDLIRFCREKSLSAGTLGTGRTRAIVASVAQSAQLAELINKHLCKLLQK